MQPLTRSPRLVLCIQAGLAVKAGLRQILPENGTVGVSEPDVSLDCQPHAW